MIDQSRCFGSVRRIGMVLLLAVAGAGSLSATDVPTSPPPAIVVPFAAGERLTYDVSWSTYVTAGTITFDVRSAPAAGGAKGYYAVAEAQPNSLLSKLYALHYKADTLIEASTLLPQRSSTFGREGSHQRTRLTRFDRAGQRAYFEQVGGIKKEVPVPPRVHDALSVLYAVRAANLRPGARIKVPVCDSGRVYDILLDIGAPETVDTGVGATLAYRITPHIVDPAGRPEPGRFAMWLSADARRVPVKFESELVVGKFVAVLREVAVSASR
jgi:hypothetical protein